MSPRADELKRYMSQLSREAYGADWIEHLEFALWHAIVSGPFRYGRLDLNAGHIAELRRLSDRCGGWVYVDRFAGDRWVPLAEWQDVYTRNVEFVRLD